ncbi:MAG TPA: ComF family protein [Candidatus Mediterraneibacter stercoripullorum]|nr:ComF family protein [Candidatus Mediterraneibacter stercoripullorum]
MDCRNRKTYIRQGRAMWLHSEPVSGAVYRFKYNNRRSYAGVFAGELAVHYAGQLKRWNVDEMIPVPLHSSRKRKRGYNQAELIGKELSSLTGIPCRTDVLFRVKKTKPQKDLDDRERRKNLTGAFAVSRSWKARKNILLIDDIYTTGSTLEKAAKMLKMAGAENIYFLTISIGQGI